MVAASSGGFSADLELDTQLGRAERALQQVLGPNFAPLAELRAEQGQSVGPEALALARPRGAAEGLEESGSDQ